MDNFTKEDLVEASRSIASMINKAEKAKEKFAQGTSQHTLLKNRLKSLNIASSLISKGLAEDYDADCYTKEDLKNVLVPLASLISKSEKAKEKLVQGTWQHTMLSNNLKALYIASSLIEEKLSNQ